MEVVDASPRAGLAAHGLPPDSAAVSAEDEIVAALEEAMARGFTPVETPTLERLREIGLNLVVGAMILDGDAVEDVVEAVADEIASCCEGEDPAAVTAALVAEAEEIMQSHHRVPSTLTSNYTAMPVHVTTVMIADRGRRDARPQGRRTGAGGRRRSDDPDPLGDGDPPGAPVAVPGRRAVTATCSTARRLVVTR